MRQPLEGKVAVVTGGGRGIGRAIALSLGEAGAALVLGFKDDAGSPAELARVMAMSNHRAIPVRANVTNAGDVESLLQSALDNFGRVDILVNNAGITRTGEIPDISPDEWNSVLDTNLKGVFHCCQTIGGWMFREGGGGIVNIASTAGIRPLPGAHPYVASKAGLIGMTRSLAMSLAPHVTVTAVAPGFIQTDNAWAAMAERIPLGRLGKPEEVAAAVRYLVENGRVHTGQVLVVDGGYSIA